MDRPEHAEVDGRVAQQELPEGCHRQGCPICTMLSCNQMHACSFMHAVREVVEALLWLMLG